MRLISTMRPIFHTVPQDRPTLVRPTSQPELLNNPFVQSINEHVLMTNSPMQPNTPPVTDVSVNEQSKQQPVKQVDFFVQLEKAGFDNNEHHYKLRYDIEMYVQTLLLTRMLRMIPFAQITKELEHAFGCDSMTIMQHIQQSSVIMLVSTNQELCICLHKTKKKVTKRSNLELRNNAVYEMVEAYLTVHNEKCAPLVPIMEQCKAELRIAKTKFFYLMRNNSQFRVFRNQSKTWYIQYQDVSE